MILEGFVSNPALHCWKIKSYRYITFFCHFISIFSTYFYIRVSQTTIQEAFVKSRCGKVWRFVTHLQTYAAVVSRKSESSHSPIYTQNTVDAATWVSRKLGIQGSFGWLTVTSCRFATLQLEPTTTTTQQVFIYLARENSSWLHVSIIKQKVIFCSWHSYLTFALAHLYNVLFKTGCLRPLLIKEK